MSIPQARRRLREIAASAGGDLEDEIHEIIDELMYRKPPISNGRRRCDKITAEIRDRVKAEFPAFSEGGRSQLDYTNQLRRRSRIVINPGRVSEIMNGQYDHLEKEDDDYGRYYGR